MNKNRFGYMRVGRGPEIARYFVLLVTYWMSTSRS
jgi:hypothetical protein